MSKLSQQVQETKAQIASMETRIIELAVPLAKPTANMFSGSTDYLLAIRQFEDAVRDRSSQLTAIEEFLPIQKEQLIELEEALKQEESESREFYKTLCEKADDFIAAYADAFEKYQSLVELSKQRPQAWADRHPQQYPLETLGAQLERIALMKVDSQERLILPGGQMVDAYVNNNGSKIPRF